MPEENKKDNLIDVGDADEAVTEVKLKIIERWVG